MFSLSIPLSETAQSIDIHTLRGSSSRISKKCQTPSSHVHPLSSAKGVNTPGKKDTGQHDRLTHKKLSYEDGKHAHGAPGLAQHMTLDRPDISCAVTTALQSMAKPNKLMQLRIVRVGGYLRQRTEACLVIRIPGSAKALLWRRGLRSRRDKA